MAQRYYTVDQVAEQLGLHVRTVRGYIRSGRLPATQLGRQYRITPEDLAAFTGTPDPAPAQRARLVEVSAIVRIEPIAPEAVIRLTNTAIAVAQSRHGRGGAAEGRLRVEAIYEEERASLKLIVLGDPGSTADLLKIIEPLTEGSHA
ncbi:helix-turn-helix domain-containing protein [Kitasatospora sp. LaBMicrA B282]|uniref:helix-turn-helix domain-containing protein n=1 Tax=Kitasatospora sp. LaBMicrA B282 TaxID=3420949 RepID=UPI003D113A24